MPNGEQVLDRLERYYDAAPRSRCRTEEIGPFTLFVAELGWPYYARPRLGFSRSAAVDDIEQVRRRQRELGVPEAIEWVDDVAPGLVDPVRASGMTVEKCPLLVLEGEPLGSAGSARMLDPDERSAVIAAQAAVGLAFQEGGTATGAVGLSERDSALSAAEEAADSGGLWDRLASGHMRMAAAFVAGEQSGDQAAGEALEVVGAGSHIPIGDVSEIVGVGVLPAYRRRGLAGHITHVLARDALERGVETVFCSAQSDDVARVYEAVGFRLVGTACIAR